MPASAAGTNTEKRATSAAPTRPVQPVTSPTTGAPNKVRTRSTTDSTLQPEQPNKYIEARKFLNAHRLLTESAPCTVQTLANVLKALAETYKMPENVAKALSHVSEALQHTEQNSRDSQRTETLPELIKELQNNLSAEMDSKLNALEKKLTLPSAAQEQMTNAAKEIGQAADNIKASINDMGNTIAQVTDTSSQLANTATNYKDALLMSREQNPQPRYAENPTQTDPKIIRDLDRKARQILIDTLDPKITGASLADIKEKVSTAIAQITNPPQPKDTTILEINKLRKGGFTILFKDKEVIAWLQDAGVEFEFTSGISPDASIVKRTYSMLIPRIPLSFDPSNDDHLREIEECNSIPAGTITKARWIKPAYRRSAEQRAAHAIFTLNDVHVTNKFIRDGIKVCGLHIRPSRLKQEPMQCMKCRRWGHFAHACTASVDTCGTCGEERRTSECSNKDKTYCVSCKSNSHASWDRECPEFRRRCDQYDENFPENSLPYYPTEETWTLSPCPGKLQYSEKFPARYTVTALQQPERPNQTASARQQGKQSKQQAARIPANQSTMDQYIVSSIPQRADEARLTNPNNANAAALTDADFPPLNYRTPEEGLEPQGWD